MTPYADSIRQTDEAFAKIQMQDVPGTVGKMPRIPVMNSDFGGGILTTLHDWKLRPKLSDSRA